MFIGVEGRRCGRLTSPSTASSVAPTAAATSEKSSSSVIVGAALGIGVSSTAISITGDESRAAIGGGRVGASPRRSTCAVRCGFDASAAGAA